MKILLAIVISVLFLSCSSNKEDEGFKFSTNIEDLRNKKMRMKIVLNGLINTPFLMIQVVIFARRSITAICME